MIVALAIPKGRGGRTAGGTCRGPWTLRLPQAVVVLFASWAVATLFVVGLDLWQVGIRRVGITTRGLCSGHRSSTTRRQRCATILALVIIFLLDAHSASLSAQAATRTLKSSVGWAFSAAVIMAAAGALTRWATAWAGALNAETPRQELDAIDRGLVAYMAIYFSAAGVLRRLLHRRGAIQNQMARRA